MNLLLVGNGFDLAHFLPTKYENFLHTIKFLINNYTRGMTNISHVFGNHALQAIDPWIGKCYEYYGLGWEKSVLEAEEIENLIHLAKNNMWFSYLSEVFDQDLGWIDFEKEIAFVIKSFSDFFTSTNNRSFSIELNVTDERTRYIISRFSYFHDDANRPPEIISPYTYRRVKDKYCLEYPKGSDIWSIDKEAVVDELYCALDEFAFLLKEYLKIFIDQPLGILLQEGLVVPNPKLQNSNRVISFNYSSVAEKVYRAEKVIHVHGTINDKIVLGINPNEDDDLPTVDTTFLQFKKYYQRVRFGTDSSYLTFMEHTRMVQSHNIDCNVTVVGHSLDTTDKDIITEIFSLANKICILYHNENAVNGYIKNLVNIYGKEGFDHLRSNKKLSFLPLTT